MAMDTTQDVMIG